MEDWYAAVDLLVEEDFYGQLSVLKSNLRAGDAYALQLREMGYVFDSGSERPARFRNCIDWLRRQSDLLYEPVKVFRNKKTGQLKVISLYDSLDKQKEVLEKTMRDTFAQGYETTNLLKPDMFVWLIAHRMFPIGDAVREHTNQTMAAHDLAHMAGFVSNPDYAHEMWRLFTHVNDVLENDDKSGDVFKKVDKALQHFDSMLSLRLYYLIEVLTEVRDRPLLERVLGFSVDKYPLEEGCDTRRAMSLFLRSKDPIALYRYLQSIYERFHDIVNPLGGESRDMYNRRRKHEREDTGSKKDTGTLYSAASSKFSGNSLYSLYYKAKHCLINVRSSHANYEETIDTIHATLLTALIGTAQLRVSDWVDAAMHFVPRHDAKLYFYLTSMFEPHHLFRRAFCDAEFASVAAETS